MHKLLIALVVLCAAGCVAHDASTAFEVRGASTRLWPDVNAIVRSYARERGFRFLHGGSPGPSDYKTYDANPPGRPYSTTLFVYRESDAVRLELIETGVSRPSARHRDIERDLKTRFEASGMRVSPTQPHTVVTF